MYQIAQLEAVNRIIGPLNGQIVSDLTQPQNDTVIQAMRSLAIATEKIQLDNEWNFHYTTGPVILTTNGNGNILVPADFISIKFRTWDSGSIWDLSTRDAMVYDEKNGTSVVAGTITIEGKRLVAYADCPAPIQNYIIERAKLEFLGNFSKMNAERMAIYRAEEQVAFQSATKFDAGLRWNAIDRSPDLRSILRGKTNANSAWYWGF